jgi:3-deoxy-D-arabino-heptulosonate 7-phosphate (DAHP) synthase
MVLEVSAVVLLLLLSPLPLVVVEAAVEEAGMLVEEVAAAAVVAAEPQAVIERVFPRLARAMPSRRGEEGGYEAGTIASGTATR